MPIEENSFMRPSPLPKQLSDSFSTQEAMRLGVSRARLRSADLTAPFHGVRLRRPREQPTFAVQKNVRNENTSELSELQLIDAFSQRLQQGQFFSHRSAAAIFGAPNPRSKPDGIHVGVIRPQRSTRVKGAIGHSFMHHRVLVVKHGGFDVIAPEFLFCTLGSWPMQHLVALGDYLVRVYSAGVGRPSQHQPALTTRSEIAEVIRLGRWHNSRRLTQALQLVREHSWSPRESITRVQLVLAGLPEPDLNTDIFSRSGEFLGCVDMAYLHYKIAIEYQGEVHAESYAHDVERIERLRSDGWLVIQVTKVLASKGDELIARVREALFSRGWPGP